MFLSSCSCRGSEALLGSQLLPQQHRRGLQSVKASPARVTARSYFMDSPVATRAPGPATLYDVLGVPRQSELKDIKSAFRHLARQSHPDVVPLEQREESTKEFLRIHAAYTTLSDPETRARYDLQLSLASLPRFGVIRQQPLSGTDAYNFVGSPPSSGPFSPSPRTPRGRSWETDQCW